MTKVSSFAKYIELQKVAMPDFREFSLLKVPPENRLYLVNGLIPGTNKAPNQIKPPILAQKGDKGG